MLRVCAACGPGFPMPPICSPCFPPGSPPHTGSADVFRAHLMARLHVPGKDALADARATRGTRTGKIRLSHKRTPPPAHSCGRRFPNPKQPAQRRQPIRSAEAFDPGFVLAVRKKLGLNQRQAGELFGGEANAFSRYELGKAKPPRTRLQLLRLLNNDPSRLRELES